MTKRNRQQNSKAVNASELAQMGVCERLVVFEHRYGKCRTAVQREAIRRGLKEHDRFYQDGIRASEKKGRCYIATLTFGSGPETATLRLFRDRILRSNGVGRWLIGVYYRTAPAICMVLERCQWLQPVVRTVLRPIVWAIDYILRGNGGDDDI